MKYCMECGTRLTEKYLEKEEMIPYCDSCKAYRFPVFNTAVSMIVYDSKKDKILLIQQYGRPHYILVAGYVNKGENAEQAVRREVFEEVGLEIDKIVYNKTAYFEPSNTLMINYVCYVTNAEQIRVNDEVDKYEWFTIEEAESEIKPNSLAREFLLNYIKHLRF